jgi:hypothetical protein
MRAKFFPVLISTFLFVVCCLTFFVPAVFAQEDSLPPATLKDLEKVFANIISIVAIIGGFLAFAALIAGGFRYITARGDPKAITAAQGMITWAIIGLAMIIISWLILKFIEVFTGVPVTIFRINI